MSYRDLQPLPADIAALLGAERRAPRPSAAHEAAIYARIEAAVGTAAVAQGAGAGGELTGGSAAAKGFVAAAPASKAVLTLVALVAGGVGVVATGYLALRAPSGQPSIATSVRSAGAPVPAVVPLPTEPAPSIAAPPAFFDEKMRAAEADLAAESALLEHARQALERGAPVVALGDVKQHARRFAEGRLIEERDALWIRALCATGHAKAARARAASFAQRFPHSIQREAVERAIRELP